MPLAPTGRPVVVAMGVSVPLAPVAKTLIAFVPPLRT